MLHQTDSHSGRDIWRATIDQLSHFGGIFPAIGQSMALKMWGIFSTHPKRARQLVQKKILWEYWLLWCSNFLLNIVKAKWYREELSYDGDYQINIGVVVDLCYNMKYNSFGDEWTAYLRRGLCKFRMMTQAFFIDHCEYMLFTERVLLQKIYETPWNSFATKHLWISSLAVSCMLLQREHVVNRQWEYSELRRFERLLREL